MEDLYKFGSSPLEAITTFVNGEKYVTSRGDVYRWIIGVNGDSDFEFVKESPLDLTIVENTVENLNYIQLNLFWKLCK
jgi:hypothetical protein